MKTNALALISVASAVLALSAASAETRRPAGDGPSYSRQVQPVAADQNDAEPSALVVGALQLAADPRLSLSAMNIQIAENRVVYAYAFRNGGSATLDALATVAMPTLEAGDNGQAATLPAQDGENPVRLEARVGGQPVQTVPHVALQAIGLDRLSEARAAGLPLLPFGKATERALRALSPEASGKLAQIGLISQAGDGARTNAATAAWSLDVTREMQLSFAPGAVTQVELAFSPVKADFQVGRGDEDALDSLKDDYCASARTIGALHARIKAGGSWRASEIAVNVGGPAPSIETPEIALSVQKPRPDSIVAFCGLNEKSGGGDRAVGGVPEDMEGDEIRIMIFTPFDR